MGVPQGNRPALPRDWFRGIPERYVAGADIRGRPEGRPYPWSQQVIHEISGLGQMASQHLEFYGFPAFLLLWILATISLSLSLGDCPQVTALQG